MLKRTMAAYLVTTAMTVAPAWAQNTQTFVQQAAISGMFEVESSKVALQKTRDKDIRDFAQRMVDEHTKANDKIKSLAKNQTVPGSLDQEHQQMVTKLQGETGSIFAADYKQMQIAGHQKTIELFQGYAEKGDDAQLKQFAQQTLPTLKDHLASIQKIDIAAAGGAQQTAQNAAGGTTASGTPTQSDGTRSYLTEETPGTWRASKVIGLGVYNQQDEKVGDIGDVLFDHDGKLEGVVIGVGGFLGIGQRNVAVAYRDLQWSMTPGRGGAGTGADTGANNPSGSAASAPGLGAMPAATAPAPNGLGSGRPSGTADDNRPPAYPDHAILANASKDQLQKAPEFKYGGAPR